MVGMWFEVTLLKPYLDSRGISGVISFPLDPDRHKRSPSKYAHGLIRRNGERSCHVCEKNYKFHLNYTLLTKYKPTITKIIEKKTYI